MDMILVAVKKTDLTPATTMLVLVVRIAVKEHSKKALTNRLMAT